MIKSFTPLTTVLILILSGCTKEIISNQNHVNNSALEEEKAISSLNSGTLDSSRGWYGFYSGAFIQSDTLPDSEFIKDGIAKLPFTSSSIDFTNIGYDIPTSHKISGDSLIFEARIKNPEGEGFYAYDVVLQIHGSKHYAQLQFVGNPSAQQYSNVYVGNSYHSNVPNLVYSFDDYKILKFVLRNDNAYVFIGSDLVYRFNYGAENEIGDLKSIYIAGKGYISCDKVRLINSYTAKRILTENFNTDGKSTIIYY